jgi:glycerophosphoryl diester phosphodiesterase
LLDSRFWISMKIELLKSITGRILVESHRGAERLAPENSWAALKLGHEAGADLLEVDVQLSQDGVAFLRHNYSLPDGRMCSAVPWDELKDLQIENEHLPLLEDVLTWTRETDTYLSLDLKVGFKPEKSLTSVVLNVLQRTQAWDNVMLISWDHKELLEMKKSHPRLTTRALIYGRMAAYTDYLKFIRADALSVSYGIVRSSDVEEIHRAEVAIIMGEMWRPDFQMIKDLDLDMVSWGDPLEARKLLAQA